jgi:hypothetical protein
MMKNLLDYVQPIVPMSADSDGLYSVIVSGADNVCADGYNSTMDGDLEQDSDISAPDDEDGDLEQDSDISAPDDEENLDAETEPIIVCAQAPCALSRFRTAPF